MQQRGTRRKRWSWRERRPTMKEVGAFFYVWLMVGFATGTLVLLLPARWVTEAVRGHGVSQRGEDLVMVAVIAVYLAASFAAALAVTRLLFQYRSRAFKYGVVLGITALAGTALWGWGNPAVYASLAGGGGGEQVATRSGAVFEFGPYPSRERLEELKAEGITAVVSLQHPDVVPFEPEGIAKEREWTSEMGIRFVEAPMLPWVSDNAESLERIKALATETGRFYVHCGLGRDRVNVVRRMLQRMGAETEATTQLADAMDWNERIAEGMKAMERGEVQQLADSVWMVPRPNEHELFGNMLAGQAGTLVLLLDPTDPEQRAAVTQATGLFDQFEVPYLRRPLLSGERDVALDIAREVLAGPRPITVIVPATAPHAGAEVAELFRDAWRQVAGGAKASGAPGETSSGRAQGVLAAPR